MLDTLEIRRLYSHGKYPEGKKVGRPVLDTVNALCNELDNERAKNAQLESRCRMIDPLLETLRTAVTALVEVKQQYADLKAFIG